MIFHLFDQIWRRVSLAAAAAVFAVAVVVVVVAVAPAVAVAAVVGGNHVEMVSIAWKGNDDLAAPYVHDLASHTCPIHHVGNGGSIQPIIR